MFLSKLAKNNMFYNDIGDVLVHGVKTIIFYNEFDVSKHPSFISAFARAQHIENDW